MAFGADLLQAEAEVFAKALALERLYGTVSSYVRARKKRVTMENVIGQVESARRCAASEEEILNKVRKGLTDPPHSERDRVDEIRRTLLS